MRTIICKSLPQRHVNWMSVFRLSLLMLLSALCIGCYATKAAIDCGRVEETFSYPKKMYVSPDRTIAVEVSASYATETGLSHFRSSYDYLGTRRRYVVFDALHLMTASRFCHRAGGAFEIHLSYKPSMPERPGARIYPSKFMAPSAEKEDVPFDFAKAVEYEAPEGERLWHPECEISGKPYRLIIEAEYDFRRTSYRPWALPTLMLVPLAFAFDVVTSPIQFFVFSRDFDNAF